MSILFISLISMSCYLAAGSTQGLRFAGKIEKSRSLVLILGFIAIVTHGFLLHVWIDVSQGQNLTFFNVLSQVAWLMAVLSLLFALMKPIDNLAVIILPLTAITILLVLLFPGDYVINTKANPKQLIHILLSFLTISVLSIAAIQALLLALQDHLLKHRYLGPIIQALPPLETMESLLFQMIAIGFILLSVVLISAIKFFPSMFDDILLRHTLMTIIAWGIFAILLIGRLFFGWRSKKAIHLTLIGVVILLISYFGGRILLEFLV